MRNDVTYLAIILALFGLMFALVKACDLIIGSDRSAREERGSGSPEPIAAPGEDDEAVAA